MSKAQKEKVTKLKKGLGIQALGHLCNNFLITILFRNSPSATHSPVFLGEELSARLKEVQLENKDSQSGLYDLLQES